MKQKSPDLLLRVPNTDEGRAFLKQFKRYLNKKTYSIRLRGRGTDRKAKAATLGETLNMTHDIPLQVADSFAVYTEHKRKKLYSDKNIEYIKDRAEATAIRMVKPY